MFEKDKRIYMTRRIAYELSQEHLHFIVQYIIKHGQQLTDYLQIFEFYVEDEQQWLIQRQEEPERKTIMTIELQETEPINEKVWVMDQESDGKIILFPSDY